MNVQRICFGLIAAIAFVLLVGAAIAQTGVIVSSLVQTVLSSFFGAMIGGFIARKNFVAPALALWIIGVAWTTYAVYSVGTSVGQTSVLPVIQQNLLTIVLTALAILVGVLLGQRFSNKSPRISGAT